MAQAPARSDAEQRAHKAWLGLVQPVGLVVSPLALSRAQVVLDKHIVPIQQALQAVVVRPAGGPRRARGEVPLRCPRGLRIR